METMDEEERRQQRGAVIAFRLSPDLVHSVDARAASEGISRADVARRALLRDLQQAAR